MILILVRVAYTRLSRYAIIGLAHLKMRSELSHLKQEASFYQLPPAWI